MKKNFRRRQRGVVLLVVLSLLTLFTLLLVTFIIVSGQYRQSALSAARASRTDVSPAKLLDNAAYVLLRDSTDPKNAVRFHSLLFDMYGGDGFVGAVSDVRNVGGFDSLPDGTNGNFFDLRIALPAVDMAGNTLPVAFDGYFNGCSLTITERDSVLAQRRTFRVVSYRASDRMFRVMPIALSNEHSTVRPVIGDQVVVNGRPFNGTGFGYNSSSPGSPQLNPAYALQPNQFGQTITRDFILGDGDESYDAVDFQNMALAGIIPTSTSIAPDGIVVIPSFHRPELIHYWYERGAMGPFPRPLMSPPGPDWSSYGERAIMRPMPWNNPDFDGSNPQLTLAKNPTPAQTTAFLSRLRGVDPLSGNRINPWDVDNDGDRIPDSVWVDLGFPLQTLADGRQVRPLFAFLCTDLDGRINLNTAGSAGQINSLLARNATTTLARRAVSSTLSRGPGLGPAEINPGYDTVNSYPLFRNANSTDQYFAMLSSRYAGRITADAPPGVGGMDTFASVKLFEFPTNYFTGTGKAYNSPPDLFGELAFGLDYRGQPTYDTPNVSRTDLSSDSPYEFDVTGMQRGRADNPFTVAELERVLRFNDAGAGQLPGRLASLGSEPFTDSNGNGTWDVGEPYTDSNSNGQFDSVFLNASRRRSVTTESFDHPAPAVMAPPELRTVFEAYFNSRRPLHVSDLLAARLLEVNPAILPAFVNAEVSKMLSWDLRAGTRMDVNRPFGNGVDDSSPPNGVVDEHGPTSTQQLEASENWQGVPFDHDNDGTTPPNGDAYLARHHFAKHLYVLAMTLKETSVQIDFDGDTMNDTPLETARGLAQWAVNVVDFRDADSIMTPFEFDTNPFNGWGVDGNIVIDEGGDREIVWGCERPELLITETLAFHDRRTEDLTTPQGQTTKMQTSGTMQEDDAEAGTGPNDFDQRLRPRGSTFIELYNPWSGEMKKPAEFYSDGAALQAGIVLNKRAPTVVGGTLDGAPVWRMIVVGDTSHGPPVLDPDDPYASPAFDPSDVERGIYFADPSSLPSNGIEAGHGIQRHYTSATNLAPLEPGRFAVVGSAGTTGITTIGRRTDAKDDGQTLAIDALLTGATRQIVLTPNASAATHQVAVSNNVSADPSIPEIKPAIAVAVDLGINTGTGAARPLNLSISEPLDGYPDAHLGSTWNGGIASGEGAYEPTLDQPLDDQSLGRPADIITALDLDPEDSAEDRNSFAPMLRTIHLQRLANPLIPYSQLTNPYRTIDTVTIDLTVFEGVHDPDDLTTPLPVPRTNPGEAFGSRERGPTTNTDTADAASATGRALWPSTGAYPARAQQQGNGDPQVFNYRLDHTLGYLNRLYGTRYSTPDMAAPLSIPAEYVGSPNAESGVGHPFPWLTWNNRPFVSQHEMMLVPRSRSSQLLSDFSMVDATAKPMIYDPATPVRQFGHLLNFFTTTTTTGVGPNLYRVFDYTHVPSRFMGTETWLDHTTFASNGNGTAGLLPPFDRIFSFREPGKVNICTIFEQRVWDAVRGPNSTLPVFDQLVDSRRGYEPPQWQPSRNYSLGQFVRPVTRNGRVYECSTPGTSGPTEPIWPTTVGQTIGDGAAVWTCRAGAPMIMLDSTFPTFFGNGFRAADAGDLVPVPSMTRAGVEATLLRSEVLTGATQTETDGRFAVTSGGAHVDPNRNPYFRYQNMQRLANLVTTRSNGYAVWVTMGMFEVTVDSSGNERLGQEAGRETGSVRRHRAFYIIDRSIPVAFQPGENHNVDEAILLRRIIE